VLGEDCLTVDIVRPAGTSHKDRLPVLVWIYGGGKWGFLFSNVPKFSTLNVRSRF
jgi:dipeptidyl aminopeptidase/acylaminoacyl peptidase